MRKILIAVVGLVCTTILFFALSCGKTAETGCTPATVASEKASMVAFCTANNINLQEHSSGILYEIVSAGTGANPNLNSKVSVFYLGKLLNGTQFDASSGSAPASFYLTSVIEGWKIAIPLLKNGGKIKMVIPSSLAYGCVGNGSIAPNTPLYFEVTLVGVQ